VLHDLTNREKEVAALAVKGYTNKEIADFLGVTPDGVKKHLRNIYAKLKVSGKTELANLASNNFFVHPHKAISDSFTGLWVSCFTCYQPDGREDMQYEILHIWRSAGEYIGRNVLTLNDSFSFYYDLNFQIHQRYALGKWVDKNIFCVGTLQLKISEWKNTMTGAYLASADHLVGKEQVFSGDWYWVKLDMQEEELPLLLNKKNSVEVQALKNYLQQNFSNFHQKDTLFTIPDELKLCDVD
jgi:DNA-binding CsgD family transcriptional regulator